MNFDWDQAKAETNLRKHGVSFAAAAEFEFDTAVVTIDNDIAYGEERMKAYGFIGRTLHVMVYVERGVVVWVISLRRATKQEKKAYERYIEQGW